MKKPPPRAVVYPKDVQNITGRSLRTAQHMFKMMKAFYNKQKSDFITVLEFCAFMKMEERLVREYMER